MTSGTCLIVTGAGGILGTALARAGAKRPDVTRVIAVSRVAADVAEADHILPGIDLATEEGVLSFRSAVGGIEEDHLALAHAAGRFTGFAPLHRTGLATVRTSLEGNLLSFIGAVEAILPAMRARRGGSIFAFSAKTRDENYPFMGSFNLAKAALESAVQTVANENARFGITANIIRLATLKTEVERAIKPAGDFEGWLDPDRAAETTLNVMLMGDASLNGSRLDLWDYSRSFFGSSMLARNSLRLAEIDPDEG
jgi:NAD(P)-dependent dehydrogenase (short-subunit alcohol dehydrogenase family)